MTRIDTAMGSLTDGDATVLVNASNTGLILGSGVSAAIRAACGEGFQDAIQRWLRQAHGGPLEPGEVAVTDAGTAPRARWVAHVAVMDYRPGARAVAPDAARIERGCQNLWRALEGLPGPLSVAMVALGAGVGGMELGESVAIACRTLAAHLAATADSRIDVVTFYGYTAAEHRRVAAVVAETFR